MITTCRPSSTTLDGSEMNTEFEKTQEDLTLKAHDLYEKLLCWSDVYMAMELDIAKKSARTKIPTGLVMSSIIDEYHRGQIQLERIS